MATFLNSETRYPTMTDDDHAADTTADIAIASVDYFNRDGGRVQAFERDGVMVYRRACTRCGGTGTTPWGTCFRCRGGRWESKPGRAYTAEEVTRLRASAERAEARQAERAAEQARVKAEQARVRAASFEADHGDAIAAIREAAPNSAFCNDLLAKLTQYGSLSERQLEAGHAAARRIADDRARCAGSVHVGTVGERRVFDLTIAKVVTLPDRGFGESYLFMFDDPDGNRVLYFGTARFLSTDTGARVRVKATVKRHDERNGVKQTIINRPAEMPAPLTEVVEVKL